MNDDRTPPNDVAAEQAVIGAALTLGAIPEEASLLAGDDFYRPAHEQMWVACKWLTTNGKPCDAIAVRIRLEETGELERVGGGSYLIELVTSPVAAGNVDYYVGIIKDRSARRRLIAAHTRGLQEAYSTTEPVEEVVNRAEERLRKVPVIEPDHTGTLMAFDEFCDQELPEDDWVIPGLLNRGDRLILTGLEGLGKSILMRQLAVCAAAGVHPFTLRPVPPMTALFVDAENPVSIMVKTFSGMRDAVRRNRGPMSSERLWVERAPAGLNLGDAQDRLWLQRLVSLVNPDLLCIGPAYKLYRGGARDKDEDLARQVTSALDAVRESVGCALVLEHHAGHGDSSRSSRDVRPFGSSLWLRWPEFGYGIKPAEGFTKDNRLVDFASWRGPRDEREWPTQLAAATGFMPWIDADYS